MDGRSERGYLAVSLSVFAHHDRCQLHRVVFWGLGQVGGVSRGRVVFLAIIIFLSHHIPTPLYICLQSCLTRPRKIAPKWHKREHQWRASNKQTYLSSWDTS